MQKSNSSLLVVLTLGLLLEPNSYMDMEGSTNYIIRHEKRCVLECSAVSACIGGSAVVVLQLKATALIPSMHRFPAVICCL